MRSIAVIAKVNGEMPEPTRIVSATRVSADQFDSSTLLGRSLAILRKIGDFETQIAFENSEGLPTIYNRAIADAKDKPAILVFVHDDVYIADALWVEELRRCLAALDIVGLAGNRRRAARQPAWAFVGESSGGQFQWDEPQYLSGIVSHGEPPGDVSVFGPPHQGCALLDGLLLAARSATLLERDVRFDPQFAFHFYDMDFCRQAELKQLKMGTAAMKVIHRSGGSFGSPAWRAGYEAYLCKYGS